MSTSIDYGTLAVGALIGVGCKDQLKACAKVAATTAASLASSAAIAANTVAAEVYDQSEQSKQSEQSEQPQGTNGKQEKEEMKVQYELSVAELKAIMELVSEAIRKSLLNENYFKQFLI